MILEKTYNYFFNDDDGLTYWFIFWFYIVFAVICVILNINYSFTTLFFILWFIVLELIYNFEPRTKDEKIKGRSWGRVIFKKIDSLFDSLIVITMLLGLYKLIAKLFAVQLSTYLFIITIFGYIIGGIGILFIYLWLNKLRDRPQKPKSKRRKK